MDFREHSELYFSRMDGSIDQKTELLRWILPGSVAELGSGSGALSVEILKRSTVDRLLALDASAEALLKMAERIRDPRAELRSAVLGRDSDPFGGEQFSTILASSVFHEVYSFLGQGGLELIAAQLSAALLPGGRLILRDGVKPEEAWLPAQMVVAPRLLELAERYCLEGPPPLRPRESSPGVFTGDRHQIAELAFTITWGAQSFERESREQYQLYSLGEAVDFYQRFGLRCIQAMDTVQPGYPANLADCVLRSLSPLGSWEPWFPATNGIWIFERDDS